MLHAVRWITYPQRFIFVSITFMRLIISILVFFFEGEIHLAGTGTTSYQILFSWGKFYENYGLTVKE